MNNVGKHKIINHSSETIFTMLLFLIFTFAILAVLISGVSVYKNTEKIMRNRFEERTVIAYVMTRLRQGDVYDAIEIDSYDEIGTLVLIKEELFGDEYRTYIYCYNGWVYELFAESGMKFDPKAGTRIVAAKGLNFKMTESDLLYIQCESTAGTLSDMNITLRSIR